MQQQGQDGFLLDVKRYIGPPNPIRTKLVCREQPVQSSQNLIEDDSDEYYIPDSESYTLFNAYTQKQLIYLKWRKRQTNRNGINYFASNFFDRWDHQKWLGSSEEGGGASQDLQFESNFEGGNLLAVYKMGDNEYHLILQNDSNSGGYTQWFNFRVSNGRQRGSVRFLIMNLYKKDSLFKQGMKPLSKSLIHDKDWKRSSHHVQYYPNEIKMEGRRSRYYRTLDFSYDFLFPQDTVEFSYSYPYSYHNLYQWMHTLSSSKLRIKYLGATSLKKIITMLHISSELSNQSRKAIVFLGRQHPGQTPSSFVIQSIVEELLRGGADIQFILSQFQFFIFPMVNVDGVELGNYRCNLQGFDLNRCWHLEESRNISELFYIKSELKKIMKKASIQMIIDFHGHSSKLNSFFYGNTFGKNNMAFPYIAAKSNPFIDLNSCSFSDQKDKNKTARVVLGNLIKDTGSAYTYQISLFGGVRNVLFVKRQGKKVPFLKEHYNQLGSHLLASLHKYQVQMVKQQKNLKGSLFLREVWKEIKRMQQILKRQEDPGSDEQAQKMTIIEQKAKQQKNSPSRSIKQSFSKEITYQQEPLIKNVASQTEPFHEELYIKLAEIKKAERAKKYQKKEKEDKKQGRKKRISMSIGKINQQPSSHKQFLLNKLRIFGQTLSQRRIDCCFEDERMPNSEMAAQTELTLKALKLLSDKSPYNLRLRINLQQKGLQQLPWKLTTHQKRSIPGSLTTTFLAFPSLFSSRNLLNSD